jgi:hypothetical protein
MSVLAVHEAAVGRGVGRNMSTVLTEEEVARRCASASPPSDVGGSNAVGRSSSRGARTGAFADGWPLVNGRLASTSSMRAFTVDERRGTFVRAVQNSDQPRRAQRRSSVTTSSNPAFRCHDDCPPVNSSPPHPAASPRLKAAGRRCARSAMKASTSSRRKRKSFPIRAYRSVRFYGYSG